MRLSLDVDVDLDLVAKLSAALSLLYAGEGSTGAAANPDADRAPSATVHWGAMCPPSPPNWTSGIESSTFAPAFKSTMAKGQRASTSQNSAAHGRSLPTLGGSNWLDDSNHQKNFRIVSSDSEQYGWSGERRQKHGAVGGQGVRNPARVLCRAGGAHIDRSRRYDRPRPRHVVSSGPLARLARLPRCRARNPPLPADAQAPRPRLRGAGGRRSEEHGGPAAA